MKQKPKYKQPAAEVRGIVLEYVIAGSKDPFNSAGVTAEGFLEEEDIQF